MAHRSPSLLLWLAPVVLLGACDNDSGGTVTTRPSPVPTPGPVGIRVFSSLRQRASGVDVVFGDANGTVLHHTQTDSSGEAFFTMDEGGMATLLFRDSENFGMSLETFADLHPGDVVETYGGDLSPDTLRLLGSIQIDFPSVRLPPGTSAVMVDLGCQSRYLYSSWQSLQGYVMEVREFCPLPEDGKVDVVVTAHNAQYVPLAFSISRDNVLNPSTRTRAYFPDGWRTDFRTLGIAYSNVTAGMTRLSSVVVPVYDGMQRGSYQGPSLTVASGQGGIRGLRYPDLAERLIFAAKLSTDGSEGPFVAYSGYLSDTPPSASVDFASDVPPLVSNVALTDAGSVRPGATWTPPADLSRVDLGSFVIEWSEGGWSYAHWFVSFPPDAQPPLRVPALPDELAAFRPPPEAQRLTLGGIELYADSSVSGYHEYVTTLLSLAKTGSSAYSHTPPRASATKTPGARATGSEAAIFPGLQGAGPLQGLGLRRSWLRREGRRAQ